MNILFVTYDFPYPITSGGKNRAYHLLKHAKKNNTITLASFVRDDFKEEHKEQLSSIGIKKIYTFKRKKLKDINTLIGSLHYQHSIFYALYYSEYIFNQIKKIIEDEKIDLIQFESFYTSFYISSEFKMLGIKQVFGTENIEYQIYEDFTKHNALFYLKPFYYFQVKKIKEEEKIAAKLSDGIIAVVDHEKKYFESLSTGKTITIENGIDIEEFTFNPKRSKNNSVLFVGNFSYFPNIDAMNFFYEKVYERIKDKINFTIIGKQSSKLKYISDKKIKIIEYVSDIQKAYEEACILVCPIRIGGGTNYKILEAMAKGVVVVAHPNAVEGLKITDGKELLIAKDSDEFVAKIEKILADETFRITIAKNARKLIEENYSWKRIGDNLNEFWRNL